MNVFRTLKSTMLTSGRRVVPRGSTVTRCVTRVSATVLAPTEHGGELGEAGEVLHGAAERDAVRQLIHAEQLERERHVVADQAAAERVVRIVQIERLPP